MWYDVKKLPVGIIGKKNNIVNVTISDLRNLLCVLIILKNTRDNNDTINKIGDSMPLSLNSSNIKLWGCVLHVFFILGHSNLYVWGPVPKIIFFLKISNEFL